MTKAFAEFVLEMTDKYSFESYRHNTLSLSSRVRELAGGASEVGTNALPKPSLEPIIEEYSTTLATDQIASSIMKTRGLPMEALKVQKSNSIEELISSATIFHQIIEPVYEEEAISIIENLCASKVLEKRRLQACTNQYLSHIVSKGRSKEFIQISAKRAFCLSEKIEDPIFALKYFFSELRKLDRKFNILIPCNRRTAHFLGSVAGMQVENDFNSLPPQFKHSIPHYLKKEKQYFAIINNIEGHDPYSVGRTVRLLLELLNSFLFIAPDGSTRRPQEVVYVHEKDTGGVYKVYLSERLNEGRPIRQKEAHNELLSKLFQFTFSRNLRRNREFSSRLAGALQAASAASTVRETDARLLSIWSAFEAILPSPIKNGEKSVRITYFAKYIAPISCFNYTYDLFKMFYNDLAKNYMAEFHKYIDMNGFGDHRFEKFLSIFFCSEDTKRRFTEIFSDSEILLLRAMELHELANSPAILQQKMDNHERRVLWQLYRIYRMRNDIVHKGVSGSYTPQLTENAFAYFQSLILNLMECAERFGVTDMDALFDLSLSVCIERKRAMESFCGSNGRRAISLATSGMFKSAQG